MRKVVLSVSALLAAVAAAFAQEEPTTAWPYLFPDFIEGTVYMSSGQEFRQKMNVHLGHSHMQYVEDGVIRELVPGDVVAVRIGDDSFIIREGQAMQVLSKKNGALIAVLTVGDFASLADTGGAYGTSSATSSTRKVSSLDAYATVGFSHSLLLQGKHDGQVLPLYTEYFLVTPEYTCPATRKDLEKHFSGRADEFKEFVKQNRIRFGKPESLAKILDFVE